MSKFLKRISTRQSSIQSWLVNNGHGNLLERTNTLLASLNRNELLERYCHGMDQALKHCSTLTNVASLDFSWYYAGRETGGALAYAYDSIKTKGTLAKSDLGPEGLPGIEIKASEGMIVDEHFSTIPTDASLNRYTLDIMPAAEAISIEAEEATMELINLWNYLLAIEAINKYRSKYEPFYQKNETTLWVTLTCHERYPVAIAHLGK